MLTIEFVRREKRLSQAQLGELARMRQSDIGLIERGRLVPSTNQLARIADALGVASGSVLRPIVVEIEAEPRP